MEYEKGKKDYKDKENSNFIINFLIISIIALSLASLVGVSAASCSGTNCMTNISINVSSPSTPFVVFATPTLSSGSIQTSKDIEIRTLTVSANFKNNTIFLYNSSRIIINSSVSLNNSNNITFYNLSDGIYYYNSTSYNTLGIKGSTETRSITIYTAIISTTSGGAISQSTGWIISGVNGTSITIISNATIPTTMYSAELTNTTWDYNRQSILTLRVRDVYGNLVEATSIDINTLNQTILTKVVRRSIGIYDIQFTVTNPDIKNLTIIVTPHQNEYSISIERIPQYKQYSVGILTGMVAFGEGFANTPQWLADNSMLVFIILACIFMLFLLIIVLKIKR